MLPAALSGSIGKFLRDEQTRDETKGRKTRAWNRTALEAGAVWVVAQRSAAQRRLSRSLSHAVARKGSGSHHITGEKLACLRSPATAQPPGACSEWLARAFSEKHTDDMVPVRSHCSGHGPEWAVRKSHDGPCRCCNLPCHAMPIRHVPPLFLPVGLQACQAAPHAFIVSSYIP